MTNKAVTNVYRKESFCYDSMEFECWKKKLPSGLPEFIIYRKMTRLSSGFEGFSSLQEIFLAKKNILFDLCVVWWAAPRDEKVVSNNL